MAGWEVDGNVSDYEKTLVLETHKKAFFDSKTEFCSTMSLYKELGAMASMFATELGTEYYEQTLSTLPLEDSEICFDSM